MNNKIYTILIIWRFEGKVKTIIHIEERFIFETIKSLPIFEIEKMEVMEGIC